MKNRLLPLFFVLGIYGGYSQVGIGTKQPSSSTQLEIQATDKGLLIPRVALKSSTDKTTVLPHVTRPGEQPLPAGQTYVNSLMVFATEANADITPGYYYWYENKWIRLGSGDSGSGAAGI